MSHYPPSPLRTSLQAPFTSIPHCGPLIRYHREQGLFPYLSSRLCNLAALAFTILCSFVLLLAVDWRAIHDPCVRERTCDLSDVMFRPDPLRHGSYAWRCGVLTYLLLFSVYWVRMSSGMGG